MWPLRCAAWIAWLPSNVAEEDDDDDEDEDEDDEEEVDGGMAPPLPLGGGGGGANIAGDRGGCFSALPNHFA